MSRIVRSFAVALLVTIWVAGCAKERPPRSYVQPNIIAKADLEGEWYYAPTTIDIGMGHSTTFVGEAGWDMSIIKWDIQENVLYARLAYDRIDNTEQGWSDPNYEGEVMGAWHISSQFDIIRDYNSTTGEEINVIKESTERPWYEREFIRVDWSENLASNWNLIWRRAATTDPINYYVNDPSHPHAPSVERNENGEAEYISIVNKVLVTPEMRDLEGWTFAGLTQLPDCFFYGSTTSCTSTEVTVRHAFWKKDPDKEYERQFYSQEDMDDFGFFTVWRLYYDRYYDITVEGGSRWYANKFNFWKESFAKATTDAEAAAHAGQDADDTKNQCPAPASGARYYCPGGGEPCRCSVNDRKIFILAERAYEYRNVPRAAAAQAQTHANGQCPALAMACAGDDCVCTQNNEPVYRLAWNPQSLPIEHYEKDGVVCPCDGQNPETCKTPCFYKIDGSKVYFETPQGKEFMPLRYWQRPMKQHVYYLNADYPEDLVQTAHSVIKQWTDVFDETAWRMSGCEAGGKVFGQDTCAARPEYDDPNFSYFVLCPNNPVEEGDDPACGPVGKRVYPGDIRYSHLLYWRPPQQSSPLGYGPPLADPLTGETVSAIANMYGAPLETYSAYARDVVRMITDDDFQWLDYLHGRFQRDVVQKILHSKGLSSNKSATSTVRVRSWERKKFTREDVRRLYNNMDTTWTRGIVSRHLPEKHTKEAIQSWMEAQGNVIKRSGVFGNGTRPDKARLNLLRNSYIEDMMMTNDILLARTPTLISAGKDSQALFSVTGADLPYGSSLRAKVSPLTWLNVNYVRAVNRLKQFHFANTHMYVEFAPFQEPSVIGVAKWVVNHYCGCDINANPNGCENESLTLTERWAQDRDCGEKVYQALKKMIFDPVAVHEMGHNVGLRHNFKGSFDALNYMDEYWNLRVQGVLNRGETEIQERYLQPRSEWEDEQRITEYQWSSLMDYGAKFNSDFNGLGKWDIAAINYAYGGHVRVFNTLKDDTIDTLSTLGLIQTFRSFSWPTPVWFWNTGPEAVLQTRFHYDPDNASVTPQGVVDLRESNRSWRPKAWVKTFEISGEPVMYTDPTLEPDGDSKFLVPFKFCSDEFRNSALGCNYFDEGADLFEITENQIQAYENYYLFNNFGRDRYEWGWDEDAYTGRIVSRYFDVIQNHLQYYVLYRGLMENDWWKEIPGEIDRFFTEDWAHYTIAVARGTEMLARVLNTPNPGVYYPPETQPDGTVVRKYVNPLQYCDPGDTCIDLIDGKYWEDTWDFNLGYQWYLKQLRIGHFYDRPLALQMLAEATNYFMGRDTQADFRLYTINAARLYPHQLLSLMGAIQSNDWQVFSPRVCEKQGALPGEQSLFVEHVNLTRMDRPPCEALQEAMREANNDPTITLNFTNEYWDPGHTFTSQLYAAVYGMTMFPMNYSQEFIDNWRVYVSGNGEGVLFPHCNDLAADGCERVTFVDPFSQKTFVSLRYPDRTHGGITYDVSIGAKVLEYAQILKNAYLAAETACGLPCEPSSGGLYDTYFRTKTELQNYVMNMEMNRSLTYTFEHPEYAADPSEE